MKPSSGKQFHATDWTLAYMLQTSAFLNAARKTYIQRLDRAVPNYVGPQSRCRPPDDDVVIYRYALRPQHFEVVCTLIRVVFESDRGGAAVLRRVGAQITSMALVPLPVWRWNYAHAVAIWTTSGGIWIWMCPITGW
jgi:hypothetical protein